MSKHHKPIGNLYEIDSQVTVICLLQVATTSELQVKCNLVHTSAHAFVFSQQSGVQGITIITKICLYNKESLFCVIRSYACLLHSIVGAVFINYLLMLKYSRASIIQEAYF
jgi:hypothetical protein